MTDHQKLYAIAAAAAVLSIVAWAWLVLWPAWTSYSRIRERLMAAFLSLYVLAAFVLAGAFAGAAVLWYYDRL